MAYLYGKPLADILVAQACAYAATLPAPPHLAVLLVGENPNSLVYINAKRKAAERAGIKFTLHHLPAVSTRADIHAVIETLNNDPHTHGLILQLPLPETLWHEKEYFLSAIALHKDVDGLTPANQLQLKQNDINSLTPATPLGVMRLLAHAGVVLLHKQVVVIGRSQLVGAPLAVLLEQAGAHVQVCHRQTPDIAAHTRHADIIISAAGHPGLITPDMLTSGVVLVDVGLTTAQEAHGKRILLGDMHPACGEKAAYITPVPGGVGPMTVACLLTNVIDAAYTQQGLPKPVWQLA